MKATRTPLKYMNRNQKNIDGDYAFTIDGANTGGIQIHPCIRSEHHNTADVHVIEDFYPGRVRTSKECPTLRSDRNGLKVGTLRTHKDGRGFREVKSGDCPTIPSRAREDGSGQPCIRVHTLQPRSPDRPSIKNGTSSGGSGPLSRDDGNTYCLDGGNCQAIEIVQAGVGWSKSTRDWGTEDRVKEGEFNALSCGDGCSNQSSKNYVIEQTVNKSEQEEQIGERRIRRLTPRECARLQGFPDDWHGDVSDTQAYKCYGNAVSVPVVKAVAERMLNG